jgi:hypothetical protein
MIKIETNKKAARAFANLILISKGNFISIDTKLKKWLLSNPTHPNRTAIVYLKSKLRIIVSSEPQNLELIIKDFETKGFQSILYDSGQEKLTNLGREVKDMFNYDGFRKSAKAIWLANQLKIKSCTYCNTQYTLTVKHDGKTKLLYHLDHFFPKSVYPYLSLSYYNLIPCCASCNMSKSDKPYSIKDNIHPYLDSLDKIAKYEATNKSLAQFLLNVNNNENKIELQLNLRTKYLGNLKTENKLKNYKDEFKVETQYQQFNDLVGETYLKGLYYNSHRKKELTDFFKNSKVTTLTQEMIHRFIVGNYTEDKDLFKRPLAKMMKDISEDFKLI